MKANNVNNNAMNANNNVNNNANSAEKALRKITSEIIGGTTIYSEKLQPRSLVLFGKNGTLYNLTTKCRNSDKQSILKALAKAVLTVMREDYKQKTDEAKRINRVKRCADFSAMLSCIEVAAVDNNGNIIESSRLTTDGGVAIRTELRFTKSAPLYQLVVETGLKWDDTRVISELAAWVNVVIKQWNYTTAINTALIDAAKSNEKEEKAAEKAEKEEKAAEKAA